MCLINPRYYTIIFKMYTNTIRSGLFGPHELAAKSQMEPMFHSQQRLVPLSELQSIYTLLHQYLQLCMAVLNMKQLAAVQGVVTETVTILSSAKVLCFTDGDMDSLEGDTFLPLSKFFLSDGNHLKNNSRK